MDTHLRACMLVQSILYTATSGIWRTVWLEPVPDEHITSVDIIPDVPRKQLSVLVRGSSDAVGKELRLRVTDGGKEVAQVTGRVDKIFQVPIANNTMQLKWHRKSSCCRYCASVALAEGN